MLPQPPSSLQATHPLYLVGDIHASEAEWKEWQINKSLKESILRNTAHLSQSWKYIFHFTDTSWLQFRRLSRGIIHYSARVCFFFLVLPSPKYDRSKRKCIFVFVGWKCSSSFCSFLSFDLSGSQMLKIQENVEPFTQFYKNTVLEGVQVELYNWNLTQLQVKLLLLEKYLKLN